MAHKDVYGICRVGFFGLACDNFVDKHRYAEVGIMYNEIDVKNFSIRVTLIFALSLMCSNIMAESRACFVQFGGTGNGTSANKP